MSDSGELDTPTVMGAAGAQRGAPGMRSGVLSLNIRERTALYAAYIPWVEGGGIFIPTTRAYKLTDEVFMLLTLMDDPNRIAVQGKVVWITPPGIQGARAHFHEEARWRGPPAAPCPARQPQKGASNQAPRAPHRP